MILAWLGSESLFAAVPKLRGMMTSDDPPGMTVGYTGLSPNESLIVWRLDRRLRELGPMLTVIGLDRERRPDSPPSACWSDLVDETNQIRIGWGVVEVVAARWLPITAATDTAEARNGL